jgi:hypothetical protein
MKFIIPLLMVATAAYWFAPAHVVFHLRMAAKNALTVVGSPPVIICANAIAENTQRLPDTVQAFGPGERLANDAGPGSGNPGQILLANEGRFESTYFSEPLTNYAIGWLEQNDIKATLDAICPEIPVGRRFEFKKSANAEQFLSESDDIRAIGADFKRVEFTGSSVNDKTYNKGLTISVDADEQLGSDWQERYTQRLLLRLYRNELRRAISAISAAATNSAVTWDTTAGKDPDFDVLSKIEASGDTRGIDANLILYGSTSWRKRSLSHRAQNTAGGFASASLTPDQLAELLGVDKVVVSKERYQSSAAAKTQVVANKVEIYFAMQGASKDDPSDIKRFVSAVDGGGFIRVFVQVVNAKRTDITVEQYSNIIMTGNLGVQQLTVS